MKATTARMLLLEDYSAVLPPPSRSGTNKLCTSYTPCRPGAPYALFAVPMTLLDSGRDYDLNLYSPPGLLERKGDLAVAIRSSLAETVRVSVQFNGVLSSMDHMQIVEHMIRPEMYQEREVTVAPGRPEFMWSSKRGVPSVLQLISNSMISPRLVPLEDSMACCVEVIYANLLDPDERRAVAETGDLVHEIDIYNNTSSPRSSSSS